MKLFAITSSKNFAKEKGRNTSFRVKKENWILFFQNYFIFIVIKLFARIFKQDGSGGGRLFFFVFSLFYCGVSFGRLSPRKTFYRKIDYAIAGSLFIDKSEMGDPRCTTVKPELAIPKAVGRNIPEQKNGLTYDFRFPVFRIVTSSRKPSLDMDNRSFFYGCIRDAIAPPEITNNGSAPTNTVTFVENATGNVIDWDSTDPDGETENGGGLTYALSGVDVALFALDMATGELTFNTPPDYDSPTDAGTDNVYNVTITVSDAADLIDVQDLAVEILKDTDGDGISDDIDLDDDNDGILDVEERYLPTIAANSNSGTGANQDKLYFFNWDGADFADGLHNGDTQIFMLPDGLTVTATISNVVGNGSGFLPDDMETWSSGLLYQEYNTLGSQEALHSTVFGDNLSFTITFAGTKNGQSFPLDLLALDAEGTSTNLTESIKWTTNGGSWTLLEAFGDGGAFTGAGTSILMTTYTLEGTSIYYSRVATQFDVDIVAGGKQAVAFGLVLVADSEGDGIPNDLDLDSDNDGISDLIESGQDASIVDTNNDGILDDMATPALQVANDLNNDGVLDAIDSSTGIPVVPDNSDNDTIPDYLDLDSDNDGIPDAVEAQSTGGYAGNDGDVSDDVDVNGIPPYGLVVPQNTDGTDTPDYIDTDTDNDGTNDTNESGLSLSGSDNDNDGIDDNINASYQDPDGDVNDPINDLTNMDGDSMDVDYRSFPTIDAVDDVFTEIDYQVGGTTASVFANDESNGTSPATDTLLEDPLIIDDGGLIGVMIASDGVVTIPAGLAIGTYYVQYQICLTVNTSICDTAVITLVSVNVPPVATDDPVTTDEDTPAIVDVLGNDTDVEGIDTTSVAIITPPANGTVTVDPVTGEVTYTPNPDFFGQDTITYVMCDTGMPVLCDTAQITVTITSVNDAPIINDDPVSTDEDTPVIVDVLGNDTDVEGLDTTSVAIITPPSNGTVTVDPVTGEVTYTPDPNFVGQDTLTYMVCDTGMPVLCDTAQIVINVLETNTLYALGDINQTLMNVPVSGNVLNNDKDPQGHSLTVNMTPVVEPAHGTVTLNADGTYTYVPDADFTGEDKFYYEVCDSGTPVVCDTAEVIINVMDFSTAMNNPPIGGADHFAMESTDTLVSSLLANDFDIDLDDITINTVPVAPNNGTIIINTDGTFEYVPNNGFIGSDTIFYEICDNGTPVLCDTVEITIDVKENDGKNDTYATDDTGFGDKDGNITGNVLSNDYDPEGDDKILNVVAVSSPLNGNLALSEDGSYIYTPNPGYAGNDYFVYALCDNGTPIACDTATVYLTIIDRENGPINPVAVDDEVSTSANTPVTIPVLANDTILETTDLNIIDEPKHGQVEVDTNGIVLYTPDQDYCGVEPDSFSYEICTNSFCDTAIVYVSVLCDGIVIHDGFSPNGDGINDFFVIKDVEKYPKNTLKVYNRWGNLVFEKTPYDNSWDASWDQDHPVPDGTYFYVWKDGEGETYSGYIEIHR